MAGLSSNESSGVAVGVLTAGDPYVLEIEGELDLSNVEQARPILDRAVAFGPERVVVDLAGLRFMDSSGLALLLGLATSVPTLELRRPSPIIRRLIEMTGLTGTLVVSS